MIVTCCPDRIPPPLVEQLRDGGRVVIPVENTLGQNLLVLQKDGDELRELRTLPVRFVPMTGVAESA